MAELSHSPAINLYGLDGLLVLAEGVGKTGDVGDTFHYIAVAVEDESRGKRIDVVVDKIAGAVFGGVEYRCPRQVFGGVAPHEFVCVDRYLIYVQSSCVIGLGQLDIECGRGFGCVGCEIDYDGTSFACDIGQ